MSIVHPVARFATIAAVGLALVGCNEGSHQDRLTRIPPKGVQPLRAVSLPPTAVPENVRNIFALHRFALEPRKVAEIPSGPGKLVLWASPARGGGWCSGLQRPRGGPWGLHVQCQWPKPRFGPFAPSIEDSSLYWGRTTVKRAKELRITLDNGRALPVPLRDGFFLYRIPNAVLVRAAPRALVAYDRSGTELGRMNVAFEPPRFQPGTMLPRPPGAAILVRKREIVSRSSRVGKVSLWEAPSWAGPGRCWWMQVRRAVAGGGCKRLEPRPRSLWEVVPAQLAVGKTKLDVLWGQAGPDVRELSVRFQDGRELALPIVHGFFLYPVPPEQMAQGHRPAFVIARGQDGGVIRKKTLLAFTING